MRVYIAGPISGRSLEEAREHFDNGAEKLRRADNGYLPINPMDVAPRCGGACKGGTLERLGDHHSRVCYLKYDLMALLECEAILMLDGWRKSVGATKEMEIAVHCGMPVLFEDEL